MPTKYNIKKECEMSLLEKYKSGTDFGRIGEGTFPARIIQVFDLGKQEGEWEGKPTSTNKLWITFELPTETIEVKGEEKPRWLSSEFTRSTNEKSKLFKIINACGGEKLNEWSDLLDKEVLIEVGSTRNQKDKWLNAMAVPKGMSVEALSKKPVFLDIQEMDFDIFNTLPKFLQDKFTDSVDWNYEESDKFPSSGGMPDDTPPF